MKRFDLDEVVPFDILVEADPAAVEAHLASQTIRLAPPGTTHQAFRGRVHDGSFELLLNRFDRRNLRPTLRGRIEATQGGARVVGGAALPSWAKWVGRGATVLTLAIAAVHVLAGLLFGRPEDMAEGVFWLWGFVAVIWMPIVSVILPGILVSQAVAERERAPEVLREVLARLPTPVGVDVLRSGAREAARARQQAPEG